MLKNADGKELLQKAGFPEDLIRGEIVLEMYSFKSVRVRNYIKISSYQEESISFVSRGKLLIISGQNLKITCFSRSETVIDGIIKKIEFQ